MAKKENPAKELGKKGGQATLKKHGRKHFLEMAKKSAKKRSAKKQ